MQILASIWKTYNPDPDVIESSQWGHWRAAAPGQPLQMAAGSTQWLQELGAMLSASLFSQVRLQQSKTSATPVECKNKFEVLQDESAELEEPKTATATATTQTSSNGHEARSVAVSETPDLPPALSAGLARLAGA